MKIKVLASGSKGNVTFIEYENTRILIDIGMTTHYIEDKLKEINVSPRSIDGILITHTHNDHIVGLKTFTKRYNTTVYMSSKMAQVINTDNSQFITKEMNIKDISVKVIRTSHDIESYGYIINDELVYITDTGYINDKYFDMIKNKKMYIMESNHDIEKLMDGPYPYNLKRRILSDKGHLSNEMCSEYLSKLIGKNTKCIVLAHLSETNNSEELALKQFKSIKKNCLVDNIYIGKPKEPTELIEI